MSAGRTIYQIMKEVEAVVPLGDKEKMQLNNRLIEVIHPREMIIHCAVQLMTALRELDLTDCPMQLRAMHQVMALLKDDIYRHHELNKGLYPRLADDTADLIDYGQEHEWWPTLQLDHNYRSKGKAPTFALPFAELDVAETLIRAMVGMTDEEVETMKEEWRKRFGNDNLAEALKRVIQDLKVTTEKMYTEDGVFPAASGQDKSAPPVTQKKSDF